MPDTPMEQGTDLLLNFRMVSLPTQMRSQGDVVHKSMIERFRNVDEINHPPLSQEYMSGLKVLDAECLRADPMWKFAPIAVVGNKERSPG
jgi:hypothetical protein